MTTDTDTGRPSSTGGPVARPPGFGTAVGVLAVRNVLLYLRHPASIMGAVAFPLVFFLGFYAVLRRLLEARGVDFGQYLPPAIVVQALFFAAISSGFYLASDARGGMLRRVRSLSVSRHAVLIARLAADSVRVVVSLAVIVAVGFAVGFRFERGAGGAVAFLGLGLAFGLTFAAGCGALGLRMARPEAVASLLTVPYLPMFMLSTAFVPVDGFPGWLQPVVRWSPVSAVIDGLRAASTAGASLTPLWRACGWLAALCVLFVVLAGRAYRRAA